MPTPSEPVPTALVRGGLAGTAATVAMSAVMLTMQHLGLEGEQPPEAIVESALDAADVDRSERTENVLASFAHLGFGASMGAAYALLRRRTRAPGPEVAHGVGWGLGIYAASYAGWIPAAGILPPPQRDRSDRQATMVLAHVVYGAALAAAIRWHRGPLDR